MDIERTNDGLISKYIHDDGSQTVIKQVPSCANIVDSDGYIKPINVDRNKYSVFISSSVGCPVGCTFCYLTNKKYKYTKLTTSQIITNVKDALNKEIKYNPDIRYKYLKLCWMGMGDCFLIPVNDLVSTTYTLLKFIIGDKRWAIGVDGVDIGTSMPTYNFGWPHAISKLNDTITYSNSFRTNPNNSNRSIVRIFYSLYDIINRHLLIPSITKNNSPISELKLLNAVKEWYGVDVILHQLFIKGVNDNVGEIKNYCRLINKYINDAELRVLRYNKHNGSPYEEADNFDALVKECSRYNNKVKYQISVGDEINASIGQF